MEDKNSSKGLEKVTEIIISNYYKETMRIGVNPVLLHINRMLHVGFSLEDIECSLGLEGSGVLEIIDKLNKINYKEDYNNKYNIEDSSLYILYVNGLTFQEIGQLTHYTKEGIRNKVYREIEKQGKDRNDCITMNKNVRKTIKDLLFYEIYVSHLDKNKTNLDSIIGLSPYSPNTFLNKLRTIK